MFVVAGATGHTGSVVASSLLKAGKPVRVFVRDAVKGEAWKARGAQVAVGTLDDAAALTKAFEGATGVYLLLAASPPNMIAGALKRSDVFADALKRAEVPHAVLLSSIGAHLPERTGPIKALHYTEKVLKALPKTKLTSIRASYFMENLESLLYPVKEQGVLPSLFSPSKKISMVATQDIGELAFKALMETPPSHQTLELSGPQEYSFDDAAAAFAKTLGKPVQVAHIPEQGIVSALTQTGMPEELAELYREMSTAMESGWVSFEGGTAQRVHGTVTLEAFMQKWLLA